MNYFGSECFIVATGKTQGQFLLVTAVANYRISCFHSYRACYFYLVLAKLNSKVSSSTAKGSAAPCSLAHCPGQEVSMSFTQRSMTASLHTPATQPPHRPVWSPLTQSPSSLAFWRPGRTLIPGFSTPLATCPLLTYHIDLWILKVISFHLSPSGILWTLFSLNVMDIHHIQDHTIPEETLPDTSQGPPPL